jgi:DNA polymerase-3 subunit gamma/tau
MSYLVFARKYRPGSFASVVGQEHVTRTLGNSIKRNRVAHAYLFAGPRGVGKTSIARIFSKALNCQKGPTDDPCMECSNCLEITKGSSLAVREIDGASHNSVDNVRELIESFRSLPAPGYRYKIYIIDEVHMFSGSAFNALLKSLEEPPPNTVFILATTEVHKIPETVISRCQRHDFRALPGEDIEKQLKHIAAQEKVTIEPEVFRMIARFSDGSMRDSQSLLDRVCSFCDGTVTAVEAGKILGVVERSVLFSLSQAIFSHDAPKALEMVGVAFSRGIDPALFLKEFASHWRELVVARFGGEKGLERLGVSPDDAVELRRQVQGVSTHDVQDLAELARSGADRALRSSFPKYALEALVVQLATRAPVREMNDILAALKSGKVGPVNSATPSAPSRVARVEPLVAERPAAPVIQRAPVGASVAAESPTSSNGGALDWGSFVRFATDEGARMLAEQLKRLSVESFSPGTLKARGPDFSVAYLAKGENKEKLEKLLGGFVKGAAKWRVDLQTSGSVGQPEPGSLLHNEQSAKSEAERLRSEQISNHPKIKSLQKVFPGSKIETIKVKE